MISIRVRWWLWVALVAAFGLGSYVGLSNLADILERVRRAAEPVGRKAFAPPPPVVAPKATVAPVAPPELPSDSVTPLKVPVIPGVGELPTGRPKK